MGEDSDWGWGRDFGGDIGLDFERLDVPLEAKRGRLEDLIMFGERGRESSERRSLCCLF